MSPFLSLSAGERQPVSTITDLGIMGDVLRRGTIRAAVESGQA